MITMDLLAGLDLLLPGARYSGRLLDNSENSYNALTWLDYRERPPYQLVEEKALVVMRKRLMEAINARTSEIIVHSYTHEGKPVTMDLEFQFNLSQLVMNRTMLTYPYEMKISDDEEGAGVYTIIPDANALATFYFLGFNHVATCLASGRQLKDSLKAMSKTELMEFRDSR